MMVESNQGPSDPAPAPSEKKPERTKKTSAKKAKAKPADNESSEESSVPPWVAFSVGLVVAIVVLLWLTAQGCSVGKVTEDVSKLGTKTESVETSVATLNTTVRGVNSSVAGCETRVTGLETKVENLGKSLGDKIDELGETISGAKEAAEEAKRLAEAPVVSAPVAKAVASVLPPPAMEENVVALTDSKYEEAARYALTPGWEAVVRFIIEDKFTYRNPDILNLAARSIWDLAGDLAIPVVAGYFDHKNVVVAENAKTWFRFYGPKARMDKLEKAAGTAERVEEATSSLKEVVKKIEKELLANTLKLNELERQISSDREGFVALKAQLANEANKLRRGYSSGLTQLRQKVEGMEGSIREQAQQVQNLEKRQEELIKVRATVRSISSCR